MVVSHIYKTKPYGFTLLEGIATSVILLTIFFVSIVAIKIIHKKERDAFRISQIKQAQQDLEKHFFNYSTFPQGNNYPLDARNIEGEVAPNTPLKSILPDPQGVKICSNPSSEPCIWAYTFVDRDHYWISFWLEGDIGTLKAGHNCASEKGIFSQNEPCT